MDALPVEIYSSAQGRTLDGRASKLPDFRDGRLMRLAGQSAFHLMRDLWPNARSIAICCGPGNNGGDGFVVAELAGLSGFKVSVLNFGTSRSHDARQAFKRASAAGVSFVQMTSDVFSEVDVIVDGILGTGLRNAPSGLMLDCIRKLNESRKPILALDVPTGLNSDTGTVESEAIRATSTISFICINPGILTANGPDRCGRLFFSGLNLPESLFSGVEPVCRRIEKNIISKILRKLPAPRHKGEAGHLLVIGGISGMGGAVRLAGEAALRVGAGSVTVATDNSHAAYLNLGRPELMVRGIASGRELLPLFEEITGIVLGPGLGLTSWSRALTAFVLESDLPVVVDADGLTLLAEQGISNEGWVLTPHPGEAARLLHCSSNEVQRGRLGAIQKIQETYGGVCVLKGAGTLVLSQKSDLLLCDHGNSGMASAGMGDVLAGIIGSLIVQGLTVEDAAVCGTWLHSKAGDLAIEEGKKGLIASDLLLPVRRLINNPGLEDG